jgi:glutathione S-transferase
MQFGVVGMLDYCKMNPNGLVPRGEVRNPAAIEEARKKCAELLGVLDAALAGNHHLTGAFSMDDIAIGSRITDLDAPPDRVAEAPASGGLVRASCRIA